MIKTHREHLFFEVTMRIPGLWTVPFLCFLAGYYTVRSLISQDTLRVPTLVGLSLASACKQLSLQNISMQIIQYKNDADMPHDTVIHQIPRPGETIRPRQPLLITLSQEPDALQTPDFRSQTIQEIEQKAHVLGLKMYHYPLSIAYPHNRCISHYPCPTKPLKQNYLFIYSSSRSQEPILWPSFIGKNVDEVLDFLKQYTINPSITYQPGSRAQKGTVIDQRPLAGSLIRFNQSKPPVVQIKIVA